MQTLGYFEADMADAVLDDRPVLYNLQNIVQLDTDNCLKLVPALKKKAVVICNEVGSGIIPFNQPDTAWREATGRLCNALAKESDAVIRMVCGIPTVLKS
ncbi:MAG: bifunctional adenosylcobinamide kinase/adenosylcobinamide-phosphate guanylyltransferase [Coriobacteriales bacterium]|nr:bifunctional adenosylcobinamide kinase/adenosylcobinamide-phosphate guanylyltransferase [Coriobacteriales bacterium]